MTKVVLQMVLLGLEHVRVFVFDLPAPPPRLRNVHHSLHDVMAAVETLVRRVMAAYGGTVQYLASNRLEVVFGAPLAQEDHAQRAVLAALALRQQWPALASTSGVPAIGLSLGLHTGLVIVEANQDNPAMPLKVLGEVALLASHLAQQASPRTILASAAVARLTHAVARLEAIPSPAVPSAAVTLYRVLELQETHTPRTSYGEHAHSRFVGRHIEMDVLHTALARVLDGQGQVVGIMGEPGMGKSRLLYEFRHAVAEQPLTYLASACQAHSTLTPYLPLRELLRQQCHLAAGVDLAEQTVHVYDSLQERGLASDEWAPYILHLLDLPTGAHSLPELSPQALRLRIFTALHQMFLQSSWQQPLVLEIDNLHWIDATSEAYLQALVERCVDTRVLLLGTYRPGYTPPWLMHPAATQLALAPLSPSDSRQIVQDVLRRHRHTAPIHHILRKAAGNPFFLEELAQTVVEQDEDTATLPMPETVQAVLAARLDQLPPGAKRVLQIAAVIGPEVSRALLQPLVNLADEELDRQLEHLQKAAFLYETGLAPEPVYTFKHVLTQEVAYQSLLRRTRQQRHAQIARLLQERFPHLAETQPELLAYHYTQAGHHEEAIASWWQAGQRAAARLAHVEARSHFTRGLSLLSSVPDTPARRQHELMLQIALGRVLIITKGYAAAEVERAFSRARQLCEQGQDIEQGSWALRGLWPFYLARAQYTTARELGEQFLSQAQGSHDLAGLIAAHEALGTTLYFLGAFVQARAHLEQGCALYTPHVDQAYAAVHLADPGVHCHAYAARALWMLGYPDQALARVQQALTLARELGQPHGDFGARDPGDRQPHPGLRDHHESRVATQWRAQREWRHADATAEHVRGQAARTRAGVRRRPAGAGRLARGRDHHEGFFSGTIQTARGTLEIVTNDAVVGGPSFINGSQISIGDGDQMLVRAPAGCHTSIRNDVSIFLQGTNQGSTLLLSGDRATFTLQGDGQFIATPQSVIRGDVGTETFVNRQALQTAIYDVIDPAALGLRVSHLAQFVNDRYLPAFAPHGVTIDPTVGRFVNNGFIDVFGTLTTPGMQNNRQLTVFAGGIADLRSGVWENLSGATLTGGTYSLTGTLLYNGDNITDIAAGTSLQLYAGGLLSHDGSTSALGRLAHNAGFLSADQLAVTPSGGTLMNDGIILVPSLIVNGNLTNRPSGQGDTLQGTVSVSGVFENPGKATGNFTAASINNSGSLQGVLTAASISNSGSIVASSLTTDALVNSGSLVGGTVHGGVLHNSGDLSVNAFQFSGPMVNTGTLVLLTHGTRLMCDFDPCPIPPPNGTTSTGTSLTNSGFLDLGPVVMDPFLFLSENTIQLDSLVNTMTGVLHMQGFAHLTVSGDVTNDGAFILGRQSLLNTVLSDRFDIGGRLVNNGDITLYPNNLANPSIVTVLTAGAFTNTGQLLVEGTIQTSLTSPQGGRVNIRGDVLNLGSIDVRGGSSILAVPVPPEFEARLGVGGAFVNAGSLSIGGPGRFTFSNIEWQGGRVTVNDDFLNSGLVNIRSSCCGRSYIPEPATLLVASGHSYIQTAGHTEVNGVLQADRLDLQGGTLGGGGTIIGDLVNLGGVVAPGGPTTLWP